MATPSVHTLQRLAAETGYQPDTIEKVLHLLDVLVGGGGAVTSTFVS